MANSFLSLEKNLQVLDKASLDLSGSLRMFTSGSKDASNAIGSLNVNLGKQLKTTEQSIKNFHLLGVAVGGTVKALFGLTTAVLTVQSLVALGQEGYKAFKQFNSVSKTLTFSEAITGSSKLADNLSFLEKTSDSLGNKLAQGLSVFTDNDSFNKFASTAVTAFSDVEEAAYRLSTVTVSGNERSISALGKNIEGMKKLQKETKYALDSVTLLNAQYDVASAGFTSSSDTQKVGKSSVNLAQAGFGNLGGSTNAIVRVLSSLGETADSSEKRAAQLFETTKVGLLTLDQLSANIGSLSSQGKQLGVSFEEINAALAVLTTQGVSADEASTKLSSFLGDVVNVSPEAARALAQFRDEAGKPIQLNSTTLKEKGIEGIIKDLKIATNGELAKIQQVFANQESQELATLLIGAGEKKFSGAKTRIKNADSKGLEEEAANRTKTLKGGFASAFNQSQAQVEDFGQSFSVSVLKQLEESNTLLAAFASNSSAAIGGFLGTLNGIQSKLQGVGTFVSSVFSTIAPLALFTVLGKGFSFVFNKLQATKKEGETLFQALKRQAFDFAQSIEDRIINAIISIQKKIAGIKSEIATIEAQSANPTISTTAPIPGVNSLVPKQKGSVTGFLKDELSLLSSGGLKNAFTGIKTGAATAGSALKLAFTGASEVIGATVSQFAALATGGALIGGMFAVIGGAADTLGKLLNRSTIPEIVTLKDTLSSIEGVPGLKESLREFDEFTDSVNRGNFALSVYGESLDRLKGLFNKVTGKTLVNDNIQQEITDRQNILASSVSKSLAAGKNGRLVGNTVEEKTVNKKLDLGLQLNPDDLKTVTDSLDNQIKANKTLVTLQEQKLSAEKANGGGNPEVIENLQKELKLLKEKTESESAALEKQKQFLLYSSKIKEFSNIKTDIPINIQISSNSFIAIESQIDSVSRDFNEAFSGKDIDPQALATKLDSIIPRISQSLDAIQTQIEIDPSSATKLREQLENKLGVNLTKYLATDPALRKKYNETLQLETTGRVNKAESRETGRVTAFSTAQQQGLDNAVLSAVKFRAETESINAQVTALTDELSKPTVPLQRQLELQGQIEQLEAKRVALATENQIKQELSAKKDIQNIDTALLSIEQAKIALYSQQNKFDLFSISLARAKYAESTKQLQISKQQTELTNRENLIKKEQAVKGLEGKLGRDSGALSKLGALTPSSTIKPTATPIGTSSPTVDIQKTLSVLETNRKNQLAGTATAKYSDDEQNKISNVVNNITDEFVSGFAGKTKRLLGVNTGETKGKLFNSDGELAISVDRLQKILDSGITSTNGGSKLSTLNRVDAVEAKSLVKFKPVEQDTARKEINSTTASAIKSAVDSATTKAVDSTNLEKDKKSRESAARKDSGQSKTALDSAKKELLFAQVLADVSSRFSNLSATIQRNIQGVELEFSVREKFAKKNEALGSALEGIGSTLSSISSIPFLSTIGSQLSTIGVERSGGVDRATLDRDKALRSIDVTVQTAQSLVDDTTKALSLAKANGASKPVIDRLQQTRDSAVSNLDTLKQESVIDRARVNEETNLSIINERLKVFAAKVGNVNEAFNALKEKVSKQAELFSSILDLNQRQKDNAAENNKAIGTLQTNILGFIGKNNPAASALSQRIQVRQIGDETKQQKAQTVTEAKKEVLDLTVQKNQLELDSRMFDNALTQTQILADILNVSQGGEATNSNTSEALARIQQIPDAIRANQQFSNAQKGLIDQKLAFIPKELNGKLARLELDASGKQLNALGGSINPSNVDLVAKSISRAREAGKGLRREDYSIGSLQDGNFTSMLQTINSVSNGGKINTNVGQYLETPKSNTLNRELLRTSRDLQNNNRQDTIALQRNLTNNAVSSRSSSSPSSINSNLYFNFQITSQEASSRGADWEKQMRSIVTSAVSDGNRALSNQVLQYAKSF